MKRVQDHGRRTDKRDRARGAVGRCRQGSRVARTARDEISVSVREGRDRVTESNRVAARERGGKRERILPGNRTVQRLQLSLIRAGRGPLNLVDTSRPAGGGVAWGSNQDDARCCTARGVNVGKREPGSKAATGADEGGTERPDAREGQRGGRVIQGDGVGGVRDEAGGILPGRVDCSRRNPVEQVHASGLPIAAWRSDHEITQAIDSRVEITGTTDRVACLVGAGSDKDRTLRRRRVCIGSRRNRRDLQPAEIDDPVQPSSGQRGAAINQVSRSGIAIEMRSSDEQVVDRRPVTVAPLTSPALATENPAASPLLAPANVNCDCAWTCTTLSTPGVVGISVDTGKTKTPPLPVLPLSEAPGSPMTRSSPPSPKRLGTSANDEPRPLVAIGAVSSKVTMVNPG